VSEFARPTGSASRARSSRLSPPRIALLLVGFAVLVVLVEAGAFTRVDQFSLDHLMPTLQTGHTPVGTVADGLYRPFSPETLPLWQAVDVWTYPCSVLISGLVMAIVSVVSWRRSRLESGLAILAAWVVGNAVELAGKALIRRPALYGTAHGLRIHIGGFDNSFPSGHMIRGMLVVAAVASLWPGARRWLLAWFAPVGPFLVLSSAHTPSDVLGGLLMGMALVGGAALLAESPGLGETSRAIQARFSPQRGTRRATAP